MSQVPSSPSQALLVGNAIKDRSHLKLGIPSPTTCWKKAHGRNNMKVLKTSIELPKDYYLLLSVSQATGTYLLH